ncbi:choice-of-anchor J domain-containing protein [Flavobacterium sp. RHBU_24]|uniref:DUF7619 domain-containing protein n=1 Tax=Flavobacterium sp. RHBU_24 TaxID=3391185 RepID=UPI0039853FED
MIKKLLLLLGLLSFSGYAQLATEGFEGNWVPGLGPTGWSILNVSGPAAMWQVAADSAETPAYQGSYAAYLPGEPMTNGTVAEDWFISPAFTVPTNAGLHFYSQLLSGGNEGTYKVMIGTDPTNISTFIELATWNGTQLNPVFNTYAEINVPIPPEQTGQQRYIAFVGTGNNAHGWLVDNVMIAPACPQPINLVVSEITLTGAMLSWTEAATATTWEIAVMPAGTVPTGAGTISTTNPYIITGLTPDTCYSYYVRAVCDGQSASPWSGPLNFCVGENYTAVRGAVHFDTDGDGICSSTETSVPNVEIEVAVNGADAGSVYTNANGEYSYYLAPGETYTVTFTPVAPAGFVSPEAVTATYTTALSGNTVAGPGFCIPQPENPVNNLSVTVTPTGQTVPGFSTTLLFSVQNTGTTAVASAPATFTFDTTRFTLQSIDGDAATGSSPLAFTFSDIDPFEVINHTITLLAAVPPVNNGGDIVTFTASLEFEDDNNDDNVYSVVQTIINSFDPNDITVHQGEEILLEQAAGYLTYTIRFENTGNGPAQKVVVEQQLDADLDWASFQPVTASHSYDAERNNDALTFSFNNINLPFSTPDDQVTGHGFITYRVKPKATIAVGDIILGSAAIYFDFNEPVITNTCSTEVVEETSGTDSFAHQNIRLYPNPVNDRLNVNVNDGTLQSVQIYDLNGRLCLTSGSANAVDTHPLSPGLYLVKVATDEGTGSYKLIKE